MDIVEFEAIVRVAPIFRDKGYTVAEFTNFFTDSQDFSKRNEFIHALEIANLIDMRRVKEDWPKKSGWEYFWKKTL